MPGLMEFLERAVQRAGNQERLSQAIDITSSRLGRVRKGGSMEVANLLKLARFLDESPSAILRAAGKAAEADLIEELYGQPAGVSHHQREFLDRCQRLSDEDRALLSLVLERLNGREGIAGLAAAIPVERQLTQKGVRAVRRKAAQ